MHAKIKMCQYFIVIKPRKFDTMNIKCFTVKKKIRSTEVDWYTAVKALLILDLRFSKYI